MTKTVATKKSAAAKPAAAKKAATTTNKVGSKAGWTDGSRAPVGGALPLPPCLPLRLTPSPLTTNTTTTCRRNPRNLPPLPQPLVPALAVALSVASLGLLRKLLRL